MASDAMDMVQDGDHLPQEEESGFGDLMADFLVGVDRQSAHELLLGLRATMNMTDSIPHAGAVEAPDKLALAAAVAEALKTVDAPISDDDLECPICLEDDDAAAWRETPCGHQFHGRCVEKWLQAKGSCPMCRRQVVTMPAVPVTGTAASYAYLFIFREYGQDVTDADAMDVDDDAYLLS